MLHPDIKTLRALLFGLSLVTVTAAAQAQTNVWIGPAVGDWSDPANWSLGVVPNDQSENPLQVRIDTNLGQDSSVSLTNTVSIGSLTIDEGDSLSLAPETSLWSGSLENAGSLHVAAGGNNVQPGLRINGVLSNLPSGLISLDQGAVTALGPSNGLFRNRGVVEGSGTLRLPFLWNEQRIDANVPGQSLRLDLDYGQNDFSNTQLTNSGIVRASNGGTLDLSRQDNGPITIQNRDRGVPGTIEAQGDSTVLIGKANSFGAGTIIDGGQIITSTEGGVQEGQVHFSGTISLIGVELDAFASFASQTQLSGSTFLNRKSLSIAPGSTTLLGTNSIAGGGSIKLGDNATVRGGGGFPTQSFAKLVNVDNTISVQSTGLSNFATLGESLLVENRGIVEADGPGANLSLGVIGPNDLSFGSPAWTNTGVVRAINSGRIVFSRTDESVFENTNGVIEVDENSSLRFSRTRIRGGIVRGPTPALPIPFRFSGDATLEDVRLEGVVNWQSDLTLAGNIQNTGTLKSDQGLHLFLGSEEVFLAGGGQISVERVEREPFFDSLTKLINVDNTLHLNSGVDFDEVIFVNRGVAEANGTNGGLTYSPHSTEFGLINSGIIRAINGAHLAINSGEYREIQNYELDEQNNALPGTIRAGAGSEVLLGGVSGGIVQAAAGGVIRVEDFGSLSSQNTPTDLQLLGRIETEDVRLGGAIRNDGQLVVSGDINNFNTNSPSQPLQLLGNGELQLGGTLFTHNSTFLNGPNHTIVGDGDINSEGSFFTNEGRIEANDNNTLNISHSGPAFLFQQRGELISSGNGVLRMNELHDWSNEGLIESRDTGLVEIQFGGRLTNQGVARVAAGAIMSFIGGFSNDSSQLVNASGAELEVDGNLFLQSGDLVNDPGATVTGDGLIDVSTGPILPLRFINNGTLSPGNAVGQLTIIGNFEQSASGDLEIELGGTAHEEYDSLAAWSADLAGLLDVSLVDLGSGEFAPERGDSFEIIQLLSSGLGNGQITGEFDTFLLPALAFDLVWGIQYNPTSVALEILAPLQADLDADGDVDGNDFLLIQQTDPSLILQWQTEFGSRVISSPASSQTVPEPTTLALALLAFVAYTGQTRCIAQHPAKKCV